MLNTNPTTTTSNPTATKTLWFLNATTNQSPEIQSKIGYNFLVAKRNNHCIFTEFVYPAFKSFAWETSRVLSIDKADETLTIETRNSTYEFVKYTDLDVNLVKEIYSHVSFKSKRRDEFGELHDAYVEFKFQNFDMQVWYLVHLVGSEAYKESYYTDPDFIRICKDGKSLFQTEYYLSNDFGIFKFALDGDKTLEDMKRYLIHSCDGYYDLEREERVCTDSSDF